jgi:hypothetical protein
MLSMKSSTLTLGPSPASRTLRPRGGGRRVGARPVACRTCRSTSPHRWWASTIAWLIDRAPWLPPKTSSVGRSGRGRTARGLPPAGHAVERRDLLAHRVAGHAQRSARGSGQRRAGHAHRDAVGPARRDAVGEPRHAFCSWITSGSWTASIGGTGDRERHVAPEGHRGDGLLLGRSPRTAPPSDAAHRDGSSFGATGAAGSTGSRSCGAGSRLPGPAVPPADPHADEDRLEVGSVLQRPRPRSRGRRARRFRRRRTAPFGS